MCVYAGSAADLVSALSIPPSSTAWHRVSKGFRYNDPAGTSDGVRRITLKRTSATRTLAVVKAKGEPLPPLALDQALPLPVLVQLRHSDQTTCFESTFSGSDVVINQPGSFEARTP